MAALNQMRLDAGEGGTLHAQLGAPPPSPSPTVDAAALAPLLHTYVALAEAAKVKPDKALVEECASLLHNLMRQMREVSGDPR